MKYYFGEPEVSAKTPAPKAFVGFPPDSDSWLMITPGKYLIALPDATAAPAGYLYVGEGSEAASIPMTNELRTLLTTFAGLTQDTRASRLGRSIFEAKTLCSPNHESTLEPNRKEIRVTLGKECLHCRLFNRNDEESQNIKLKKQESYTRLRGNGSTVDAARVWMRFQEETGFHRVDVQPEQYRSDGPSLAPSTTYVESGTPDLDWVGVKTGINFEGGLWNITGFGHAGGIANHALSSGDQYAELTIDSAVDDLDVGPIARADAPNSAERCYGVWAIGPQWHLRAMRTNNFADAITIAVLTRTTPVVGVHRITVIGSDITLDMNGEKFGPFTDTLAPDSHLYGGFYSASPAHFMDHFTLTDEVSSGGGRLDTITSPVSSETSTPISSPN